MATRQAKYNRDERRRRLEAGRCVQCGGPRPAKTQVRPFVRCQACRELNRPREAARMRRARAAAQG